MICPKCGFSDENQAKFVHNIMNEYVDDKTGKVVGVLNSDEDYVTLKDGTKLRKSSLKPAAPTTQVLTPSVSTGVK